MSIGLAKHLVKSNRVWVVSAREMAKLISTPEHIDLNSACQGVGLSPVSTCGILPQ